MSYAPILTEPKSDNNISKTPDSSRTSVNAAIARRRQIPLTPNGVSRHPAKTLSVVVHRHLLCDCVRQRPQQFIPRLSRKHKALLVDTAAPDPELATPVARFRVPASFPNVTVLSLQFPAWRWGDGDYVDAERRRLVQEFLRGPAAGQFENPIQWFYDPMAAPSFLGHLNERLVVYDCMDELSKFRCAPPEIVEREALLLKQADVVFTGGYKLFESKRRHSSNCHFYGCGVDSAHFGRARS